MNEFLIAVVVYAAGYLVGRGQRQPMTGVFLLTLPRCQEEEAEIEAALDGLQKRGIITPEQAEAAKRRIAEGGEAGKLIAKSAEPVKCPKCGWKAGEA